MVYQTLNDYIESGRNPVGQRLFSQGNTELGTIDQVRGPKIILSDGRSIQAASPGTESVWDRLYIRC